ncbi:hypothetical protein [Pontibacter arcticus]|uniref:Uncharacterized protein n=1 Tax=Pontibacter arcticus TaxID=2080288 RepID=A0A364RDC4_9BACT|nr:hypothetical protein [Pontibacter arcticus]RAU82321.1 hypothetical protein DP923_11065 [Pontibacter arcticus]
MPQYTYFLDDEQQKKLVITRKFTWKELQVYFNDELIGKVDHKAELTEGRTFTLPDQSILSLKLKSGFADQLEVLRNGQPLAGSATDIDQIVRNAWQLMLFLGALNLVLGLLNYFWDIDYLQALGTGLGSFILGPVYIGLSIAIRRFSVPALYAAISILVLDIILSAYMAYAGITEANMGSGVLVKSFFIYTLFKAIAPLKEHNRQQAA